LGVINIIAFGESYLTEGLASTKRIAVFINELMKYSNIKIINISISKSKRLNKKILDTRIKNNVKAHTLYIETYINIFKTIMFYLCALILIHKSYLKSAKNIVYYQGSPSIDKFLFLLIFRVVGFKVIFDIGEDQSLHYGKSIAQLFKNYTTLFLLRNIDKYSVGAIAISSHLVDQISSFVDNRAYKIFLIPSTVDHSVFRKGNIKKQNNGISIFYGGSFGEKDGLEYLLGAFDIIHSTYPNSHLLISGMGTELQTIALKNTIDSLESNRNIHYLGFLSEKDYVTNIMNADILLVTRTNSRYANAGFPVKLGEYLATGNPVVATDVGDISKYLNDKHNVLLVKPESKEDIAMGIRTLLERKDYAIQVGLRGREASRKYFDAEIITSTLYKIFTNIES
jgi:glycosyltransferase involved in cell wall biosynthesis